MIGLDTNVLVRFLLQDDPAQAAIVNRFLEGSCTPDEPCVVNRATLCELVWVLTSAYKYRRPQIAQVLDLILRTNRLEVENAAEARAALHLFRNGRADFADCLVGVTNRSLGCRATITFDRDAARMPEYSRIDVDPSHPH